MFMVIVFAQTNHIIIELSDGRCDKLEDCTRALGMILMSTKFVHSPHPYFLMVMMIHDSYRIQWA